MCSFVCPLGLERRRALNGHWMNYPLLSPPLTIFHRNFHFFEHRHEVPEWWWSGWRGSFSVVQDSSRAGDVISFQDISILFTPFIVYTNTCLYIQAFIHKFILDPFRSFQHLNSPEPRKKRHLVLQFHCSKAWGGNPRGAPSINQQSCAFHDISMLLTIASGEKTCPHRKCSFPLVARCRCHGDVMHWWGWRWEQHGASPWKYDVADFGTSICLTNHPIFVSGQDDMSIKEYEG